MILEIYNKQIKVEQPVKIIGNWDNDGRNGTNMKIIGDWEQLMKMMGDMKQYWEK